MVKKKVGKGKKTEKKVQPKAVAAKRPAGVKKVEKKKTVQKSKTTKKPVKKEKKTQAKAAAAKKPVVSKKAETAKKVEKKKKEVKKAVPVKKPVEMKVKKKVKPIAEKEEKPKKLGEKDVIFTVGKRKRSVARARLKKGAGAVEINKRPLDYFSNEIAVMKIREPLMLAGDDVKRFDISVNVKGGGVMGQAEACRQAIARGLVQVLGSNIKQRFLAYDRSLLVYDPRRTEPHKPSRSSAGARRYKQKSKR